MAIERARAHLARHGVAERLIETAESSATVELAAKAVGIEPRRIAKSLSFLVDGAPVTEIWSPLRVAMPARAAVRSATEVNTMDALFL